MSVANLAARLDALDGAGSFVSEGEQSLGIANLDVDTAAELLALANALGWPAQASDPEGTLWSAEALDADFAPFRVEIDKPAAGDGKLRLLTNTGFAEWLVRGDARAHWEVAGLEQTIRCFAVRYTPWNEVGEEAGPELPLRSPRTLVREFAGQRSVPADIGSWLLRDAGAFSYGNASALTWANIAARRLILALPDEYDADHRRLRFKGPPRLDLELTPDGGDLAAPLGEAGFRTLQLTTHWVFEVERETEMRHILLATELARCGGSGDVAAPFLRDNLAAAAEGARTAYQIQLAGLSSDTLKTLAELRKSVTDETAKLVDATRQIITAVVGALALGAGLVAARLTTTASSILVILVMAIAAIYVAITIVSGVSFMRLQRGIREQWQPRLYRFLSKPDYAALVGTPATRAETMLKASSWLGGLAVILMMVAIFLIRPVQPERGGRDGAMQKDKGAVSVPVGPDTAPILPVPPPPAAAAADKEAAAEAGGKSPPG